MKRFALDLAESELKIILEALTDKEKAMAAFCEQSDDEDIVADTGNDLIELRLLLEPLKEKALEAYGEGILNFSKDLL
ncbi:hypothetical protein [Endozoicomonas arenosclerae]|uniref:hypothetical protein n=1 Tax=Endozoicomonas arenosclerae TaxID=1633495 RepID=UPI000780B58A|nr:hypothetical protein [Endozoicomonas arenosclerae]